MEDYTAKRLAEALEGLSSVMQTIDISTLEDMSENARRLYMSMDDHNQKIDKYIESNDRVVLEQAIHNATQQLIQCRIAYKRGELDKDDVYDMLKVSRINLTTTARNYQEKPIFTEYKVAVDTVLRRYAKILGMEAMKAEDFKF